MIEVVGEDKGRGTWEVAVAENMGSFVVDRALGYSSS